MLKKYEEIVMHCKEFGHLSITIVKPLQQLENSLIEFGEKWILNPGDGAFYGPKVRPNSHATYASNTETPIMSQKPPPAEAPKTEAQLTPQQCQLCQQQKKATPPKPQKPQPF